MLPAPTHAVIRDDIAIWTGILELEKRLAGDLEPYIASVQSTCEKPVFMTPFATTAPLATTTRLRDSAATPTQR